MAVDPDDTTPTPIATTEITMVGGARYRVDGEIKDVEAQIIEEARGSIMSLVWLTDTATRQPVAINPKYVVGLGPRSA